MKSPMRFIAIFFAVFVSVPVYIYSQTFAVIHNFGATGDGNGPASSLVLDSGGSLYGVTQVGGSNGDGTVFQLQPNVGGWSENILHSFTGTDGCSPRAPVTFDQHGNILATTSSCPALYGGGSVVELIPNGGTWSGIVRHLFAGSAVSPLHPLGGIAIDATGHLYGTTQQGGPYSSGGVVYTLGAGGSAVTQVIHAFGNGNDGHFPQGNLVMDSHGNLYGTTAHGGGSRNAGTVYELSPDGSGGWTENILHAFQWSTSDGGFPQDGLIIDGSGNLYGTTDAGGTAGWGTVFKLSPNGDGTWTQTILYSFQGGSDGAIPYAGVTMDPAGNLYGTTFDGGLEQQTGTVYKLTPQPGGQWVETVLHRFSDFSEGWNPASRVVLDQAGKLYGTTGIGGAYGGGVAWQITP
jgi:uncharacterized repeat protein (TIGR03803 family)